MKKYSDEEFFNAPFRGVTTVLDTVFGNKFKNSNIPDHILKMAAERGSIVHKYIEDWLNWYEEIKGPIDCEPHLGLEYGVYETVWKEWLEERIKWEIKPMYIEQKIINKKLGIKGIIDCIALINGRICLVDWKTSSNLDEWSTNCQLQLYYMMLLKGNKEEREIAKQIQELRCLNLTKTGYRWFKFDINKNISNSILKLWDIHFKEIAEAEKLKEKEKPTKGVLIL